MLSRAGVPLEVILALFAACAVVIKLTAIGRLSRGSTTAIALYACSFIYLHELTQVRAALAIGIWMHALVYLRTHPGRYLLLTALAMTFHLQAALGLLFWLLRPILNNRRSAIGFLMAGLGIVIVGGTTAWFKELGYRIITLIPDPRTEIYLSIAESGVWVVPNPFSVMSILAMVTAIMLTKRQRNQDGLNSSLIRPGRQRLALASTHSHLMLGVLLMLGSVALVLMSSVSVAAFRVSEHFFALIPVGLGLAINRWHPSLRLPLTLTLAAAFLYLFLLHSPYVNDPRLGEPAIDDA
jgi:hypothetical protein